jgi:hypothetical protein
MIMRQREKIFILFALSTFLGCGTDHSEEIAALQKQVAALTSQLEETRKQGDTLRDGQRKIRELIGTLEVEVGRLKPLATSQPTSTSRGAKELGASPHSPASTSATVAQGTAKVACPQVWKLLGQGQDEATVAQTLGTTEEAVRTCEQEVGQGKRR